MDEYFIIHTFSTDHPPSIENDYYAQEIVRYLENHKALQVITGTGEGIREYELPLRTKPKHRMVAEREVRVVNGSLIARLLSDISYKAAILAAESSDTWHCRFQVDDQGVLWMTTEIGSYPLRKLSYGLATYKVMVTLCETGAVELDDNGLIKSGPHAGTKVRSLQDTLRGVGFDRVMKKSFFEVTSARKVKLKTPAPAIGKSFHAAVIETFEESTRLKKILNRSKREI